MAKAHPAELSTSLGNLFCYKGTIRGYSRTYDNAYSHSNVIAGVTDLEFLLEITNREYEIVPVDPRGVFVFYNDVHLFTFPDLTCGFTTELLAEEPWLISTLTKEAIPAESSIVNDFRVRMTGTSSALHISKEPTALEIWLACGN